MRFLHLSFWLSRWQSLILLCEKKSQDLKLYSNNAQKYEETDAMKMKILDYVLIIVVGALIVTNLTACADFNPYKETFGDSASIEQIQPSEPSELTTTEAVKPAYKVTSPSIRVEVKEEVKTALETAKAVNQYANPTPFAPLVNLGLDGIGLLLGIGASIYGYFRNQKYKQTFASAKSIIQGIEKGDTTGAIKEAVQTVSTLNGNLESVHKLVKDITK